MKCYNHPEIDAVGLCKSCGRGLCHECVSEVGTSISCKSRCESDVAAINELLQRGRTAYQKASGTFIRSGIFILLLGAVFLIIGVVSSIASQPNYFLILMGLLFVSWGISQFFTARRYKQK